MESEDIIFNKVLRIGFFRRLSEGKYGIKSDRLFKCVLLSIILFIAFQKYFEHYNNWK